MESLSHCRLFAYNDEEMMTSEETLTFLKRDLSLVSTDLELEGYEPLFEQEVSEHFPFAPHILQWLADLYSSEKYACFDEDKLSLYYEKKHPFLFVRDLAHINAWNQGYQDHKDRLNHVTGLLYSGEPLLATEATLALCRPSRIQKPCGDWFDFKQAMGNLDFLQEDKPQHQALKASALFYLYFHLSDDEATIFGEDLVELIGPYEEAIASAYYWGSPVLKKECKILMQVFNEKADKGTLMDALLSS